MLVLLLVCFLSFFLLATSCLPISSNKTCTFRKDNHLTAYVIPPFISFNLYCCCFCARARARVCVYIYIFHYVGPITSLFSFFLFYLPHLVFLSAAIRLAHSEKTIILPHTLSHLLFLLISTAATASARVCVYFHYVGAIASLFSFFLSFLLATSCLPISSNKTCTFGKDNHLTAYVIPPFISFNLYCSYCFCACVCIFPLCWCYY